MKTLARYVIGALLCLSGVCIALAQVYPVRTTASPVGFCHDRNVNAVLQIREISTLYNNGFIEKLTQLIPPFGHPAFQPQPIAAAPDPSGIHLLAVRSAIAGQAFWVTRNGRFITISASGQTTQIGNCQVDPSYASQFPLPIPLPPAKYISFASGFDGKALTGPGRQLFMPEVLLSEGFYNIPPVIVSPNTAKECSEAFAGDEDAFFKCIASKSLGDKEKEAFECSTKGGSQEEIALCLFASQFNGQDKDNLKQVQACYAQHGSNWNAYPACIATSNVDPKVMNAIQCARQSFRPGQDPNYWSFGACVLGPSVFAGFNPNAESQIMIDCAMMSRGNPQAFLACSGGRLLSSELEKCVTKGFGNDGCFGDGNSLSKLYDEVGNNLKTAFGDNSVAFHAWQVARTTSDPKQMIESVNNISREVDKAERNLTSAAKKALGDAGDALAEVVPQVKVGKPKGKIFGKKWSW